MVSTQPYKQSTKLEPIKAHHVSIDPGIDYTGIAVWDARSWEEKAAPLWTKTLRPGINTKRSRVKATERTWDIDAETMAGRLHEEFALLSFLGAVFIEFPVTFQASARGSAAVTKSDLYKLCYLIGQYGRVAAWFGAEVRLIEVTTWKGQLPKMVTQDRLRVDVPGMLKVEGLSSHEWDAIGIGWFAKGFRI
jgi:hypothetical protein